MSNYSSQTYSSAYPFPIIREYPPKPYYYSHKSYPSTFVSPISNSSLTPSQYISSLKYFHDDDEAYFSEYHHHRRQQYHRHNYHSNHQYYSDNEQSNRTSYISSQSQPKSSSILNENAYRSIIDYPENIEYETKKSMSANENNEHGVLKRDQKRTTNQLYKPLNETEFLTKTQAEIRQEFRKLSNPSAKDPYAAKEERNLEKSRYRDVIPGEATRVKLQPDGDEKNDFINANYVSGYKNQEKSYIFTQGPLPTTVKDFWRMIWQENISIIVMTTNIRENGTVKCHLYWPSESKQIMNCGLYQIQNDKSEKFDSFVITTLILRKKNHSDNRIIYHAHYLKWPDHGIPSNTTDALLFLEKVEYYRQITMTKSPILLHCSAGIGRTGTFCAIDIGIKNYLEEKIIDVPSTVIKMRNERAGSVQTEDQYLFVHLALIDFIKNQQATRQRIYTNEKININISNGLNEINDNIRKTSRSKTNGKKQNTLTITSSDELFDAPETTLHKGNGFSDSSVATVQYLTPTISVLQTEPNRQRSLPEQISSTAASHIHHKKVRK